MRREIVSWLIVASLALAPGFVVQVPLHAQQNGATDGSGQRIGPTAPASEAPASVASAPVASAPVAKAATAPAAAVMRTVFSPARAPRRKTMGLLQRSFLDLADQGDLELEVAIVVDGTDSMAAELEGVRTSIEQMIEDLTQYRDAEARVAIVVYRDAGSPSGDATILLDRFTNDRQSITAAVKSLRPESGAPFFHELPDLGVHRALTQLPWSEDDQVAKWILLFGDAPPYAESFRDAKTPEAYRRYATPLLVSIARQKNIRVNCVLCTSSDQVVEPYRASVDETRSFMNALAAGTDGVMLDLSYEEIREAMLDAGRQPGVELAKINPISEIDLASARREDIDQTSPKKSLRLAVIPHLPIDEINFDPGRAEVQFATALRSTFARVPGVHLATAREVKEQLRRLRSQGLENRQAIRGLAAMLGVDFVIWGELQADRATVRTAAHRRGDGHPIVTVSLNRHAGDAAYALIRASSRNAPDDEAIASLMKRMQDADASNFAAFADSPATHDELMASIETLEQSLAFDNSDSEGIIPLDKAMDAVNRVLKAEPRNVLAHWVRANLMYNMAANAIAQEDAQTAQSMLSEMRKSLTRAVDHIDSIRSQSFVTEIEADYYLLMQRDAEKAANRYQELTDPAQPLPSQLRGHWMLAGIYAGDWGNADQPIVDPVKSRFHIIQILANWPNSPEAKLLKRWLRWDETERATEFDYLPIVHVIDT